METIFILSICIIVVVQASLAYRIQRRQFIASTRKSLEVYERYVAEGVALSEDFLGARVKSDEETQKVVNQLNAWEKRVYRLTNLRLMED